MPHSFISDVKDNENISGTFGVVKKMSVKKYANGFSFILELCDKTGTMNATYWGPNDEDSVADIFDSIPVGGFIEISGKGNEWNNKLTISIDGKTGFNLQKVDSTSVDLENFMKKSTRDIPEMIKELRQIVSEINNEHIKKLLESFTNDNEFMGGKYSQAPAAKMMHHDFVGGLLEHVLNLIATSKTVQHSHPELNLDLLIAACILHDIGKVIEYETLENFSIGITTPGRLFGHISIGFLMVEKKISEISNFPNDLRLRMLHIILSHHRKLEHGSPVTPMIPEAIAFGMIDDTDGTIQHNLQLVEKSNDDWKYENDFSGKWRWTKPMDENQ
jgi:3'-5' exoribonuclease